MSDQTHGSVLTNAPIPDLVPGSVVTDPAAIAAALQATQAAAAAPTPLRYAGTPEARDDSAAATVSADELHAVPEPQKATAPRLPMDLPAATSDGAPPWALVPPDMVFPRGRSVYFLRFDARLTYTPAQGIAAPDNGKLYRQCIFWPMSVGDKKFAAGRSMGDQIRFSDEMVKSCIRAIDGSKVDLSNAQLDIWWDQVGEKVRGLLHRIFGQAHYLTPDETTDFLVNCVAVRSAG